MYLPQVLFAAGLATNIILFKALSISYAASKEDQIFNRRTAGIKSATQGIVFLGTPHRGSDKAKWGSVATKLMGVVLKDHNSKVIDALIRGSETLERIQNDFSRFLITLSVYTCYEDVQYEKIGKVDPQTMISWSYG